MTTLRAQVYQPTFRSINFSAEIQQQLVLQQQVNVHYHLPPQPPADYGAQAFWIPPPAVELSAPPAGRGVKGASPDDGWPQPSYETAGGYKVVFDGKSESMKIYGPDQEPGDTPLANVWGDPHVYEGDGTRWDFTKDGDMVLPDGTLLAMDTTSETGRSFLEKVDIVNGADRVTVSGISKNKPDAGFVRNDGYSFRAQHVASHAGTDRSTFVLGGRDDEDVTFNLFVRGVDQGEVTSAKYDGKKDAYVQVTDGSKLYQPDPDLLPPLGSKAWGNAYRAMLLDTLASSNPQLAQQYGAYFNAEHQSVSPYGYGPGALGGLFGNFNQANGALADLGNLMLLQGQSPAGLDAANPQFLVAGPGGNAPVAGGAGFHPGLPGLPGLPGAGATQPAPGGNHVIQNSNIGREQAHRAELDQVMNDPSLSVEDKVMLTLMLIMKKMDQDIEGQLQYISRSQNQGANRNGATQGGHGLQQGQGVVPGQTAGAGGAGGTGGAEGTSGADNPSIDIETAKLERMVKKRGHMFEMLKSLISKYDETAKSANQAIGR